VKDRPATTFSELITGLVGSDHVNVLPPNDHEYLTESAQAWRAATSERQSRDNVTRLRKISRFIVHPSHIVA